MSWVSKERENVPLDDASEQDAGMGGGKYARVVADGAKGCVQSDKGIERKERHTEQCSHYGQPLRRS
jgi:hypothetical protein